MDLFRLVEGNLLESPVQPGYPDVVPGIEPVEDGDIQGESHIGAEFVGELHGIIIFFDLNK